ncbi:MAG: PD-(D/E)XK nuclease family protein, partial [Muribaculaceae bacterium]|nr:PD-(D/E)XK nuclease family protein [Muribaculaceae bacterium]
PTVRLIVSVMQLVQASRHKEESTSHNGYASRREVGIIIQRLQYMLSSGKTLDEAISDLSENGTESAADKIEYINSQRTSTLMSMVEFIEATVIDSTTRERDKAFIIAFNDCVADYCATHMSDLHSFLRWWNINSRKLAIPSADGTDAVKVMTVHKSKGLQFECVIMPCFKSKIVSRNQSDWYKAVPLPGISQEVIPPLMSIPASKALLDEDSPFRMQAIEFRKANTIDALNLAYVGFTRAISELTVIGGKEDESTVSPWLTLARRDTTLYSGQGWHEENTEPSIGSTDDEGTADIKAMIFEIGEPTCNHTGTENTIEESTHTADTLPPPEFISTFRSDLQQFTCIPDDSEPEYTDSVDAAAVGSDRIADKEELMRGDILHRVLSLMHTTDDLDHAFERIAYSRHLDHSRRTQYHSILTHAFEACGEHVKRWFTDFHHTLNERPIYLPERQTTYRPDRVVWTNEGTVEIIDYKFTARASTEHRTQIRGYIHLLRAMGYKNIKAYLWYLLSGTVTEVTDR